MEKAKKNDVVVIGSGPGGYVAAIRAAQLGFNVTCVEKEKALGGTCLNVGCIPSKSLLQSTEHYDWIRNKCQEHGISCKDVSMDFSQLMKRKEQVVGGLTQGVASLFKRHNITHLQGTARFLAPHTIEISSGIKRETLDSEYFILATGSEPIPLPFLPFDEKVVVSSTGALSLPSIPKRMVIIGGGVIGVEIASVYRRLGTDVTIVEMLDSICVAMDDAVSKALLQILKKQDLKFHLGSKVTKAERTKGGGVSLTVQQGDQTMQLETDVVLVAIGRRPYSTDLRLLEIGVQMQKGFVKIDSDFRSSLPHIFAIGDLIDSGPMLAHRASAEGVAVAEIIAGQSPKINYMAIPNVIYTHPEVAALGMTESEARKTGKEIVIGTAYFRGNPRARCNGDTDGFVKVIGAGKENYLVGMHILGPQASELIDAGMVAIEKRATLSELANYPHAHPTLAECIKEACGQALGVAIH